MEKSIVLAMFEKEGDLFRQRENTARDVVSLDKEMEVSNTQPPTYNTGLYQLVTGTVDIRVRLK